MINGLMKNVIIIMNR